MNDNESYGSSDGSDPTSKSAHDPVIISNGVVEIVRRKSYIFTKRINVSDDNRPNGKSQRDDELQGQVVTCHYRNRNNCENLSKITIASVALPEKKVKPPEDRGCSPFCWHGQNGARELNENEYCKKTPMPIVREDTKVPVADNNNNNNKNNRKDLKEYQTEGDVRMSLKAYEITQHDTVRSNSVSKPSKRHKNQEYYRHYMSESSSDSLITQSTFTVSSELESECELPVSAGPDNYTKTTSVTTQQPRSKNLLLYAGEISTPKPASLKNNLKDYSSRGPVLRYRKKKPMNTKRSRNSNGDADDDLTDDSNNSEIDKEHERKTSQEFQIIETCGMMNRQPHETYAHSTGDEGWNYGENLDYSSISCRNTPLPTPPPSALKKSGSTSGSSIGKKQKVQFDPAIEIHFVPRDCYPTPDSLVNGSTDEGVEIEEVEDDLYSEFSTENDFEENDVYNPFIYDETLPKALIKPPGSPFRVIKRETPLGRSRMGQRGRRDSLDLTQVQKVFSEQSRDRAVQIQRTTDHERRYPRIPYVNGKSTHPNYRISNGSYYSTIEKQKRQIQDSKIQMRNNMMSPEHYVAYYTRQQQLQQYMEHERRLRRQQLLTGNIKQKDHSKDKSANRNKFFETLHDGVNEEVKKEGEEENRLLQNRNEKDEICEEPDSISSKPRPYTNSQKNQQQQLSHDEQSRLSSGYGGSNTGSDDVQRSDVTEKVDVNGHLFLKETNMKSGFCRTVDCRQPYTPHQVAEVIRAAGSAMRKGGNITYYSEKNRRKHDQESKLNTSNQERQYDNDFASKGNFAKLSENARNALHHAHIAYTSSLSNMMPVTKSIIEVNESKSKFSAKPSILADDQRKNILFTTPQPTVRYLHGNTRGKIPQSFIRQKNHKGTCSADWNLVHGLRIGSGHLGINSASCSSSSFQTSTGSSRPSTAESVTIDVLGLSARLPASNRFSAQPVRGHFNLVRSVKPLSRSSNEATDRLTSANKARYMRSMYDDQKKMTKLHVLDAIHPEVDSTENIYVPRVTSCYTARKTIDDNNSKLNRTGPPQLRGNHHPYHGHKNRKRSTTDNPGVSQAPQSSIAAPPKILA